MSLLQLQIAEEDQPPELERMLSLRVDDDFDHITPIADEGFSITLHTTASDMSQIRYRELLVATLVL